MADELVTVKEAARLTGKSPDTVKRWIKAGKLKATQTGASDNAPVMVRRADALALVRALAAAPRHHRDVVPVPAERAHADDGALHGALQAHLADVVRQRDALERRLAERDGEVAGLRLELADARRRLEAVERELRGGVRGLLTRGLKRVGM